jgi:hypothetical protein
LEKDEKEFTQTARGMQLRKLGTAVGNPERLAQAEPSSAVDKTTKHMIYEGDFFGENKHHSLQAQPFPKSPAMKPMSISLNGATNSTLGKRGFEEITDVWVRDEDVWDGRSPENIDLDELDGMFDGF